MDQRSGRYPVLLDLADVQSLQATLLQDETGAGGVTLPVLSARPRLSQLGSATSTITTTTTTTTTRRNTRRKPKLFVAHFCQNLLTDTLEDLAFTLLQGLFVEQRELRQKHPLKFKARQRYVAGFHEVLKHLKAGHVKLVLLAADVEVGGVQPVAREADGSAVENESVVAPPQPVNAAKRRTFSSLDEAVANIFSLCGVGDATPAGSVVLKSPPLCLTCMSRQRLSYALHAKGSTVACVGVMQAEQGRTVLRTLQEYGRRLCVLYDSGVSTCADSASQPS